MAKFNKKSSQFSSRPSERSGGRSKPTSGGRSSDSRPSFGRDNDRPTGDRPARFGRDNDRPSGDRRPSFGRDNDRPSGDRPARFGRDNDRPSGDRRPSFGRDNDRPTGDRRPSFGRDNDRPSGDRPSRFGRDNDRPSSDRRPSFGRDNDRPTGDRPSRFGRDNDRPSGDRPSRFSRDNDRPTGDRPARFSRDNERPTGDRPSRFSRDNERPTGDRPSRFSRDNDRPAGDRPSRFGRDNDRPTGDRPSRFSRDNDRPTGDRPSRFSRDNDRPTGDRRPSFGRDNDRPSGDRPASDRAESSDRRSFSRRTSSGKPFYRDAPKYNHDEFRASRQENREDNDRTTRPRRSRLEEAPSRRVGERRAPQIDDATLKAKLPPKVLKRVEESEQHTDGSIRLNRYIANAGVCSRREADELIAAGDITVNGKVETEMGHRVMPTDVVKYKGKLLTRERYIYVLLNKPKDYITTTDDPDERRTVMDLVQDACSERIYPVGRLDRNTTGLLLLTNDGELADKLSHPSNEIRKIYQVELNKPFTEEDFETMKNGIELEDGFIKPDDLAFVTPDAEVVGIEIHSGKNRIVRRLFEHLGYEVLKLDRSMYAGLTKKELPRGKWRFLSEKEVVKLKYMS